jgi:hypothetical protein
MGRKPLSVPMRWNAVRYDTCVRRARSGWLMLHSNNPADV